MYSIFMLLVSPTERFLSHTDLGPQTGCTLWSGARGEPGRTMAAAYEAEAGDNA